MLAPGARITIDGNRLPPGYSVVPFPESPGKELMESAKKWLSEGEALPAQERPAKKTADDGLRTEAKDGKLDSATENKHAEAEKNNGHYLVLGTEIGDRDVREILHDAVVDAIEGDKDDVRALVGTPEKDGILGKVAKGIAAKREHFEYGFPVSGSTSGVTRQFGEPEHRMLCYGLLTASALRTGPSLSLFSTDTQEIRRKTDALQKVARSIGAWYDHAEERLAADGWKYLNKGSEAKVYEKDGASVVTKLIDASQYEFDPEFLLQRILLHNAISPAFPLVLKAIGKNGAGDFVAVVEQPRIDKDYRRHSARSAELPLHFIITLMAAPPPPPRG